VRHFRWQSPCTVQVNFHKGVGLLSEAENPARIGMEARYQVIHGEAPVVDGGEEQWKHSLEPWHKRIVFQKISISVFSRLGMLWH
jgi:hypothetical protein